MMGMIKKDLYMIKNNYKTLIILFIIYLVYTFEFDMDMSFFLPFMGLMACMSTISYDDYNNFHAYAATLPQGKKGIVKAKYITTIAITLLLAVISILISLIIGHTKGNIIIMDTLSTTFDSVIAMILIMSVIFPLQFKYGTEKGRFAMVILGLSICGLILIITRIVKINLSSNLLFIDKFFPIIAIFICIIIILISYFITKKIYLKREF